MIFFKNNHEALQNNLRLLIYYVVDDKGSIFFKKQKMPTFIMTQDNIIKKYKVSSIITNEDLIQQVNLVDYNTEIEVSESHDLLDIQDVENLTRLAGALTNTSIYCYNKNI